MTQQRISQLNELGFTWQAQEAAWLHQFNVLEKFYREHGHCNVHLSKEKYPKLGTWVKDQRRHYASKKQGKPSKMSMERYHLLTSIDFSFDPNNSSWWKHFHELEQCQKEHGSCMIPINHMDPKLLTWIHYQRRQFKKWKRGTPNRINAKRVDALNRIGFVWTPRKSSFDEDANSHSSESCYSNCSEEMPGGDILRSAD
jgi:hypothetical protein